MADVALTPTEIMQGALIGVMRQVQNLKAGLKDAHGAGLDSGWQLHIEGAMGEMALAKYLNCYYGGTGKMRASDVCKFDVRTSSKHFYNLIVHEKDPDDRVFWLLTGCNGVYVVRGWIKGCDAKNGDYWKDPAGGRPAYFVPQNRLNAP